MRAGHLASISGTVRARPSWAYTAALLAGCAVLLFVTRCLAAGSVNSARLPLTRAMVVGVMLLHLALLSRMASARLHLPSRTGGTTPDLPWAWGNEDLRACKRVFDACC